MAHQEIPRTAVVRVSRGSFDPARFADVEGMRSETSAYLAPAIAQLEGLLGYYAGTSPDGSIVDVSLWDSDEHANQMGQLKEMIVDARHAGEVAGATFIPIVNYPLSWQV
jgi:hypothetical protein